LVVFLPFISTTNTSSAGCYPNTTLWPWVSCQGNSPVSFNP
jgi:hypothetical protein